MSTIQTQRSAKLDYRVISFAEVAQRLCISERTMRRRIDAGVLPKPERVGKTKVYRESKLPGMIDDLLASNR